MSNYRFAADGTETILHSFDGSKPDVDPISGLTLVDHRVLVGTTTAVRSGSAIGGPIFGLWEAHD